ncbi:protein amalgam-like [Mercenaria mercenaria]|uniref:protein amalgam-like n=1 Tax=Mercenaria mercenaria TaxID=6596 RepID=UPI00234E75BC|nr:protein amalgam-like [Mercenaria mercenaria]
MEYGYITWNILILIYSVLRLVESQLPPMSGPDAPVLDTAAVTVTVAQGMTASLPCRVQNPGDTDVSWFTADYVILTTSDLILNDDSRLSVDTENPGEWNLVIVNVQEEDTGTYKCMLQSFPPQEKFVTLKVNTPPVIDKGSLKERYLFQKGESLTVICKVSGYPEPFVKWYAFKTITSTMEEVKELVSETAELVFEILQANDGGIYRCEAVNEMGKDMYEIFLQEVYEPRLKAINKTIVVKQYLDAVLQCEIESNPSAKTGWQRDGKLLKTNFKYNVAKYTESEYKIVTELTINEADKLDSGEYLCLATNFYGRKRIKFNVIVDVPTTTTQSTTTTTTATTTIKVPKSTEKSTSLSTGSHDKLKETTTIKYVEGPKTGPARDSASINTYSCTLILSVYSILLLLIL